MRMQHMLLANVLELEIGCRLKRWVAVGAGVDHEQEIALVDDLPILEVDLGQRPSDLRAQLDAVDGRKLPEQADPRVDVAKTMIHCHAPYSVIAW